MITELYSTYRRWNTSASLSEKGVIAGADLSQEWLLPWWWRHYHSFNTAPVTFIDFGMSDETKEWCQKRGRLVCLPVADIFVAEKEAIDPSFAIEWENTYGKDFWSQRSGWFKKPLACLLSPYLESIWIDLDCEIREPLDELFNFCSHPSGIALAKDIHDPLGGKKGYNSGVIVFKHGIPLIEAWADQVFKSNHAYAGDQDILTQTILDKNLPIADLPPIYNWSRCSGENTQAKIFHWHGKHGKTVIHYKMLNIEI